MNQTKLKICGLKDPDTAQAAVEMGVDYIGVICDSSFRRYVSLDHAKLIADRVHHCQGVIVPVFFDQTADEILQVAAALKADIVQLHGKPSVAAYATLKPSLSCIVVAHLCEDLSSLDPQSDFLVYDNLMPGSGKTFSWDGVEIASRFRSFIAGGINIDNALDAIEHFHPYGIDVSSGVEDEAGEKSLQLIQPLVHRIKN